MCGGYVTRVSPVGVVVLRRKDDVEIEIIFNLKEFSPLAHEG